MTDALAIDGLLFTVRAWASIYLLRTVELIIDGFWVLRIA
jgi:hypothetical protein